MMAVDEINAAGGIKGLGKIDAVLGDALSTPEGGTAEVEKMNSAGVVGLVQRRRWRQHRRQQLQGHDQGRRSCSGHRSLRG